MVELKGFRTISARLLYVDGLVDEAGNIYRSLPLLFWLTFEKVGFFF